MTVLASRLFGEVPLGDDGGFVTRALELGARTIERSLYVGDKIGSDPTSLLLAQALLERLESLDVQARAALRARLAAETSADEMIGSYLAFHREELDPAALGGAGQDDAALLARLDLVGVAVHGTADEFFVLDYSFGRAVTDQLLAVKHDAGGAITDLTHES
ncbi:MAG: DUF2004 domain-containing protein [Kofleriaceae bacterium]